MSAIATPETEFTLPPGMMLVRNTLPEMAGQKISRRGKIYKLDAAGRALVAADCGIERCGKGWVVEEGTPQSVQRLMGSETRTIPTPGPLHFWQGRKAECGGERVMAPDGTIVLFNANGIGEAPDNCGLARVPGYLKLEAVTDEGRRKYRTQAPTTQAALAEAREAELLGIADEEEDPYQQLFAEMAARERRAAAGEVTTDPVLNTPAAAVSPVPTPVEVPETLFAGGNGADSSVPENWLDKKTRAELADIATGFGIVGATDAAKFPNKEALRQAILAAQSADEEEPEGVPSGRAAALAAAAALANA